MAIAFLLVINYALDRVAVADASRRSSANRPAAKLEQDPERADLILPRWAAVRARFIAIPVGVRRGPAALASGRGRRRRVCSSGRGYGYWCVHSWS